MKVVERNPISKGDAQFEVNRQAILKELAAKVPADLVLAQHLIDNPPLDVTGVPKECGLLTPEELDITENYGLIDLAEAIAAKKFTSVAVTSAFCKRAIIAHQLTCCLSGFYMHEALEQAKKLDEHLERTGKTVGPLHGVPISVKEIIPVKGMLWSLDFVVTRAIAQEDAPLISIVREMGAVFYVKTHQPAAVFSLECTSFLGRTLNPFNIYLSSGGSSGGEAALLAMRGSPFGLGTDLGGSIRTPASFCGIYGLKGSSGFLPVSAAGPAAVTLSVDSIIGPMGHELRDLDYVLSHVLARKPHLLDPECLPIPYTGLGTAKSRSALKIGILKSYGLVQPQPPAAQAIEWAEAQLRASGFRVTEYKFYEPARAHRIIHELLMHDGMSMARAGFKAGNEPAYPRFDDIVDHALDLVEDSALDREESAIAVATKRFHRDVYRKEFLADWIAQGNPDIVICPVSPACAHETGNIRHNPTCPHFWNLLDYPGLAVPTHIRAEGREKYPKDQYEDVKPLTEEDRVTKELWKQHDYTGAPIALNIVAKRHMENELIAAVGMMQRALKLP